MSMLNPITYEPTASYKLIYIFRINMPTHQGILKIGDASIDSSLPYDQLAPNSSELNQAARTRIKRYTNTAGVAFQLLHTEIAVRWRKDSEGGKHLDAFRDWDVHDVLTRSGIKKVFPNEVNANEWFKTDLETAKNAIKAFKEGRTTLYGGEVTTPHKVQIILREEQEDAINKTIQVFKTGDQMLWNAKMRYGKTVTALSLVKRQLDKYKKTLIITHRPVVQSGWREDFNNIFNDKSCRFETKTYESDDEVESSKIDYANEQVLRELGSDDKPFIYFASIQDLRGSQRVGGKHNKNNAVFDMDWDLIINDEAHEGTQTELGLNVATAIKKKRTKLLSLSGTPFNIIYQYDNEAIYTWDYVMEQARKEEWEKTHPGDPNPYASLPQMHIYTFDLGDIIKGYRPELEGKAFNFSEFFRTWTGDPQRDGAATSPDKIGTFINELDVEKFINLISKESDSSAYPFSTQEYREMFRHTLWKVPGVKEAKALSVLLKKHPVFKYFGIANVAGDGDDYEETHAQDALSLVRKTIKENDYSITLSCGKLTTGVTIPQWTACFMLSGSYTTAAANYLQTIFRVQSPGNIKGKAKEHCYVFDFAPDRTLRVISEAANVSRKAGSGGTTKDEKQREIVRNFLNYCPVIAIDGTTMQEYSVDSMMQQIKHVLADRAINSGFEDISLYNDRLMTLDKLALKDFEELRKIIKTTKANKKTGDVPVNEQGMDQEEYEQYKKLKNKKKKDLTPEEKAKLKELKKQKEEKCKAISILRGVSVRMPLLIFGADVPFTENITISKFIEMVDEDSWKEFMPKKVTKELFGKFVKYYDPDVFVAAAREIRLRAKRADGLLPTERVQQIALIHSKFKNPDKETVLTPWRVVNLHMSDCLGGYCFYDESFAEDKKLEVPRLVDKGKVTADTLMKPDAQILEINSKTGLYPLYVAYSIYRAKCKVFEEQHNKEGSHFTLTDEKQIALWEETVRDNLFVISMTPMAKAITRRTLLGYREAKVNIYNFDNLIHDLKFEPNKIVKKVCRGKMWDKEGTEMKFDAIIGNPPYMIVDSNQTGSTPIYQHFVSISKKIKPMYISLIIPARWFSGGKGLDDFRDEMLQDNRIRELTDFPDSNDVFSGVSVKGGICYFLWDRERTGLCRIKTVQKNRSAIEERALLDPSTNIFIRYHDAVKIVEKVMSQWSGGFSSLVSARKPFGLETNTNIEESSDSNDVRFYVNKNSFFVKKESIPLNKDWINTWKVFITYAYGAGDDFPHQIINKPFIGGPNTACSETYLLIGPFETKKTAENVISYLKTRFARFMIMLIKNTQHATKIVYRLLPVQDFTKSWTDAELYAKYKLNKDEIAFIENMIRPMPAHGSPAQVDEDDIDYDEDEE